MTARHYIPSGPSMLSPGEVYVSQNTPCQSCGKEHSRNDTMQYTEGVGYTCAVCVAYVGYNPQYKLTDHFTNNRSYKDLKADMEYEERQAVFNPYTELKPY